MQPNLQLPPPNFRAFGLFVTDDEWDAVVALLNDRALEPSFRRAWIFGSRASGVRRMPDEPLDIDLAVEYDWPDDLGEQIRLSALREPWRGHCASWHISVDPHGIGAESDKYHVMGVQVWPLPEEISRGLLDPTTRLD